MPKQRVKTEQEKENKRHHQMIRRSHNNKRRCNRRTSWYVSYGPPWAHYFGGYQDRLLGGPQGLPGLRYTAPEGVEHKDYTRVVLG
jgi:hypothetical protein